MYNANRERKDPLPTMAFKGILQLAGGYLVHLAFGDDLKSPKDRVVLFPFPNGRLLKWLLKWGGGVIPNHLTVMILQGGASSPPLWYPFQMVITPWGPKRSVSVFRAQRWGTDLGFFGGFCASDACTTWQGGVEAKGWWWVGDDCRSPWFLLKGLDLRYFCEKT